MLVWGIVLVIGGLLGQRDIFKPIPEALLKGSLVTQESHLTKEVELFSPVSNLQELDIHIEQAKLNNQMIMIDYYADWCVDCVRMEKTTFANEAVINKLKTGFISIQIDVTDPSDLGGKELKQRFNVFGPPATLFLDSNGRVLADKGFYGYMDSTAFLDLINTLQP